MYIYLFAYAEDDFDDANVLCETASSPGPRGKSTMIKEDGEEGRRGFRTDAQLGGMSLKRGEGQGAGEAGALGPFCPSDLYWGHYSIPGREGVIREVVALKP